VASSSDNSNTARLRFDSQQDALDFASQCVKNSKHWLAVNSLDFVKRYKQMEIEIVIEFFSRLPSSNSKKFHLLFRSIPRVGPRSAEIAINNIASYGEASSDRSGSNRRKDSMLIGVTEVIQRTEKPIPSWVWLERAKERINRLRNILAVTSQVVFKSGGGSGKGEVGVLRVDDARCTSNSEHRVIQNGPEISNAIASNLLQLGRKGVSEFDLAYELAKMLRIRIEDSFVGLELKEEINLPLEITDVFFSPCEFAP
jgi:hypothetical protein